MKIDKLYIQDYGQFHEKEISLAPGMNLIYGSNEAGKTTAKDFMEDMLYGIPDGETEHYGKRKPIHAEAYAGAMDVTTERGTYRIERNFLRKDKNMAVRDLESGQPVETADAESVVGTLIQTERAIYENTALIGQPEPTSGTAVKEMLDRYIVSRAAAKAGDIDAIHAVEQLREKQKTFSNEECVKREQEITAKLQLERDFDAELAAVQKEYQEASAGGKKEKLQFEPIKNPSMREEDPEEPEQESEPLTARDRDVRMLQGMGRKSVLDNGFVLFFLGLVMLAIFVAIAYFIPVNVQQLKLGIMGFGALLTLITMIQVFSRRAKLHRLLEELEIEQGFEEAKEHAEKSRQEDQTEVTNRLSDLKRKEERILKERNEQEELLIEINGLKDQMAANEKEWQALDLAIRTIQDLSEEIYDSYGSILNERVSALVRTFTHDRYAGVKIDHELKMTVKDGASYIGMDYLSTGTREQIALALRLVLADVLLTEEMPIIIDDIFATYDYQRLYDTLSCLGGYGSRQVILLTTNAGVSNVLADLGIANSYIAL